MEKETKTSQMTVENFTSQKMEAIGQLAAGIAHEINTPTQYIGDNTNFLQGAFKDFLILLDDYKKLAQQAQEISTLQETVKTIQEKSKKIDVDYLISEIPLAIKQSLEGIERVSGITKAMKEFSHPGSQEAAPANLNQNIKSTVTVCRNEWKYVADVETQLDPQLPEVPCCVGEINQVVLNMIINATHAISDKFEKGKKGKGLITISTHLDGDWIVIKISDNGAGISEKNKQHIFEPFFTTKAIGKGTGQGLMLSFAIIKEKHKGELLFDSKEGEGTTFTIRLPLISPLMDDPTEDKAK
ncbi:MAG: ATP-binding protein [Deltaproteobacteria bacterium]|nr:MAG: ATP-binding protein [Deltaproteobacteria bacterium]